jgi:benzoylformate decarboxylase
MLFQAKCGYGPIVVVEGEAGVRYDAMEARMPADLVAMAKPVTKWAPGPSIPGRCCACLAAQ